LPESRNLKKFLHQWGGTTGAFFAYTHFSHDLCAGLLVALLPLIRVDLELNYLQSGLLISAYSIAAGLSQFPGGWIGDRANRKIIIMVGLGGVGLAALAVGLSPSYFLMLSFLVIMGIFAGGYHPSALSILSGYFGKAERGKVIAIHMLGGSIGLALGPVLGGFIGDILGWRSAYIILTIPILLALPLVLKTPRQQLYGDRAASSASTNDGTPVKPTYKLSSLWQVLRPIAMISILAILIQLVVGCAIAFFPIYMVDKHNLAPAYAAMFLGIFRGGGVAGSLLGGWLSDRWGRKNTLILSLLAIGPILYLLTKLPFNAVFIVIFVLFGVIMYMRIPAMQAMLMDNTPPHFRATVTGIYIGLGMEGTSIIQPIAGRFMDIWGIAQVFNIIALISVGLSVVAPFLAKRIKLR
jgi:FSR family fosmidomycin resistance protein-like MFS transporter